MDGAKMFQIKTRARGPATFSVDPHVLPTLGGGGDGHESVYPWQPNYVPD